MKVGTVSKITVSVAAIVGLGVIGTHHFISSMEDSSPSVEIITSTAAPRTDSTRKRVVTTPRPANEPQISAEEMEQIEGFFAQLETADAQESVEIPEEKIFAFKTNENHKSPNLLDEEYSSDETNQKTEQRHKNLASKVLHAAKTYENILLRRLALASGASPEEFGITGSQEFEEYKNAKWNFQIVLSDYLHARGPNDVESDGWIHEALEGIAEFWFDGDSQLNISVTDRMLEQW